jgi:Cys-tRNA(Pro)/Cys-tRNA(Cys) deacylase
MPGKRSESTPATTALARAGVAYAVHPYPHDPNARSFGVEAAAALGVSADRVFKTLVASVDGRLVVAVVPVSGSLNLKSLAAAVNGKRAELTDASLVERTTGYVPGGVSPFGQRRALPTVVDETAMRYVTVFVSGGRRGLDVEVAPDDLVRLTGATVARIGRPAA